MARDSKASRKAVFQAADDLARQGGKVSVSGVRDKIGGGDPDGIHDLLVAWRDERRAQLFARIGEETAQGGSGKASAQAAPGMQDLPPALRGLVGHFVRHLAVTWLENQAGSLPANDQMSVIRAAAEARVREAEGDARELGSALHESEERVRVLVQERDALRSALETAEEQSEIDATRRGGRSGTQRGFDPEADALHRAAARQIARLRNERDTLIREAADLRDALSHRKDARDLLSRPSPAVLAREAREETTDEDADMIVEILSAARSALRATQKGAPEGSPETGVESGPDFDRQEQPVFARHRSGQEFEGLAPLAPLAPLASQGRGSSPASPFFPAAAREEGGADAVAGDPKSGSEKTGWKADLPPMPEEPDDLPDFSLPDTGLTASGLPGGNVLPDDLAALFASEDEEGGATAPSSGPSSGAGEKPGAGAKPFFQDDPDGKTGTGGGNFIPSSALLAWQAQKEAAAKAEISELQTRLQDMEQEIRRSREERDQATDARRSTERELEEARHRLRQQAIWISEARSRMEKAGLLGGAGGSKPSPASSSAPASPAAPE